MGLEVFTEMDARQRGSYTDFLHREPSALFYQSLPYHDLLKKHLHCHSVYFIYSEGDQMLAALPLLFKEDPTLGAVFNSLPYYGSNGGFTFAPSLDETRKDAIREKCIGALERFAGANAGLAFTIITNPFQGGDQRWLDIHLKYDFTDFRIGQITVLPPGCDSSGQDLLELFSEPRPRNIRRAMKSGLLVEVTHTPEALSFLYEVHKQNIESIGGKAKRKEFFDLIPDYFKPGEYDVYIAYKNQIPVAGLLLFYFNQTIEYFTPATVHEFRSEQPSALIIFEAMKQGINRGFRYWNWGGTWSTQQGVYDFKKRWGADDYTYLYFTKVLRPTLLETPRAELLEKFSDFYLFPFR